MKEMKNTTEGTPAALEAQLDPPIDISGIAHEKDEAKLNALVFELYKEALSVVNLAAHILDEAASIKGGWPRNQAICAGLMVRITKFMLVVVQLSAKGNRFEVVAALNRSIMESAVNLEFLVRKNDERFFDQFVKFSLGPERELYDLIKANIEARNGEVWPIELRMLKSIDDVCRISGVKIEDAERKYGDWGGGVKERLKALNKEEQYVSMQRIPSHAVHGTWVDLCQYHLKHDAKVDLFAPDNSFDWVDARALSQIAVVALDAVKPYIELYLADVPESKVISDRVVDLQKRMLMVDAAHEELLSKSK